MSDLLQSRDFVVAPPRTPDIVEAESPTVLQCRASAPTPKIKATGVAGRPTLTRQRFEEIKVLANDQTDREVRKAFFQLITEVEDANGWAGPYKEGEECGTSPEQSC